MDNKSPKKKFYMHKISNLLNIQKIVTIHYQSLPSGYVSKEESHDFWEIIYADKDGVSLVINGESVYIAQGEIFFIKPNDPHFVECGDENPNIFIISFSCHSESMRFFVGKKYSVPDEYRSLLEIIMYEAHQTFIIPDFDPDLNELKLKEKPNLGGEQIIKNTLESLLIYLLRLAGEQKSSQEFFVSKINSSTELQDEILRILADKVYGKLSLQDICAELHYGKTKLCTFFREKTGMTIYDAYQKLKTDEAKKLIRRNVSFVNIADKLCYDSVSSFNSAFKKQTGLTPGEYKKSIKK
jgi:AraC-like DNA-binding protein